MLGARLQFPRYVGGNQDLQAAREAPPVRAAERCYRQEDVGGGVPQARAGEKNWKTAFLVLEVEADTSTQIGGASWREPTRHVSPKPGRGREHKSSPLSCLLHTHFSHILLYVTYCMIGRAPRRGAGAESGQEGA